MEETKNVWLSTDGQWCLTTESESKFKLHSKQYNAGCEILKTCYGTHCCSVDDLPFEYIPKDVWKVIQEEYKKHRL